jgi:dipeptidyl aminopeptidase/acylaminoacyl peptidase
LIDLEGNVKKLSGRPPATTSSIVWTDEGAAYQTESASDFPAVWTGSRRLPIPQSESYSDLRIKTVSWKSFDDTPLEGVVYERSQTPADAPLLVRAHGGPAGTVEAVRSEAARSYRHLLRAGYRVFNPAFRGSMGFGDDFLSANVRCQGEDDLKDILTGIDHLVRKKLAKQDRVGIYGGSFGGYMTIRALASTDRFRAGAALYGFVSNRWMTLETGDFTYEDEYFAPIKWSSKKTTTSSDIFPHLGAIQSPLLLLHGDRDPICTLSQSMVTYRALEARGIPTGVVVYPGEGHGFRKPENRRDCARRVLGWFLEYLPA